MKNLRALLALAPDSWPTRDEIAYTVGPEPGATLRQLTRTRSVPYYGLQLEPMPYVLPAPPVKPKRAPAPADQRRGRDRDRNRERYRRRHATPVERACVECGRLFITVVPDNRRKYCGPACRYQYHLRLSQLGRVFDQQWPPPTMRLNALVTLAARAAPMRPPPSPARPYEWQSREWNICFWLPAADLRSLTWIGAALGDAYLATFAPPGALDPVVRRWLVPTTVDLDGLVCLIVIGSALCWMPAAAEVPRV